MFMQSRISRFWNRLSTLCLSVFLFLQPMLLYAAKDEGEKKPEWVLSYALILFCIFLAVTILLRSGNRAETAFTQEELDKRKEDEMNKLKKH